MDQNPLIEGVWERVGDEFAGCSIRVTPAGGFWEGTLIYVNATASGAGWGVGDRKWVDIRASGHGRFQGRDLQKAYDFSRQEVLEASYVPKAFRLKGRKLTVSAPEWWSFFGAVQTWQRLG